MFTIARQLPRTAATSFAALALSAICIGAAVAPARADPVAAAPATLADWQKDVSHRIDVSDGSFARTHDLGTSRKAVVAVRLDADGRVTSTALRHASGDWTFDRHAVRTAAKLAYPPLPDGYRGRPQTVQVNMLLASRADMTHYQQMAEDSVAEEAATRLALQPTRLAAK